MTGHELNLVSLFLALLPYSNKYNKNIKNKKGKHYINILQQLITNLVNIDFEINNNKINFLYNITIGY